MSVPQEKPFVISSLSDIENLSPHCSEIRFRKFVSKLLVSILLEKCIFLEKVVISKSAYDRCDRNIIKILEGSGIEIEVSKMRGRPSLIEVMLW